MVFWDEVTDELAAEYPDVTVERYHVDAAAARMVTHPESFDVIVASNLFGDILSDIGAAIQAAWASQHRPISTRPVSCLRCLNLCMAPHLILLVKARPTQWQQCGLER